MFISKRNRLFAGFLAAWCVAFLFFDAEPSRADSHADVGNGWDHEVATQLANDLEQTLEDAYARSLKAPPQQTVLQQRERDAAQGVIRRARDLSKDYAQKMRAGWSRKASEPHCRVVVEEVALVWDTSGDAVPAVSAKPIIGRLQKILDELQALYDAASLPE